MRALLIAAALSLAFPASAVAKLRPYIPPGNSGANEYVESVPTAGGSNSTGNVIQSGGASSSLAPATQSTLTRQGPDGRAAAALANATAPATLRNRRHQRTGAVGAGGGSSGTGSTGAGAPAAGGGSPVGAVLKSLFGLQGQGGAALPVIMIMAALVLGAGRMLRRRAS